MPALTDADGSRMRIDGNILNSYKKRTSGFSLEVRFYQLRLAEKYQVRT